MGPLFIFLGIKRDVKCAGVRADFCTSCLHVTRFDVFIEEIAPHVFFIPGNYRENGRYSTCQVCGATGDGYPVGFLSTEGAADKDIKHIVDATNKSLASRMGAIAFHLQEEMSNANEWKHHVISTFFRRQEADFDTVTTNLGGVAGLLLIVLTIIVGLGTFDAAGTPAVVFIFLVAAVFVVFLVRREFHRQLSSKIHPVLSKLLSITELKWSDLEECLESTGTASPRLQRHLIRPEYDDIRSGHFTEDIIEGRDYLTPSITPMEEAELREAMRHNRQ